MNGFRLMSLPLEILQQVYIHAYEHFQGENICGFCQILSNVCVAKFTITSIFTNMLQQKTRLDGGWIDR